MSMRELLRIEMSAAQVREACEQWAAAHSAYNLREEDITATLLSGHQAIVVFTKKRAPRAKDLSNRVVAALQERLIEPAEGAR